jgi:DNA-binding transcriptional MerR regulator
MRLYSQRDIETLRKIARLTEDLGVNLAGVEVVLNMTRRIEELQEEMAMLQQQAEARIAALRQRIHELERGALVSGGEFRVLAPDDSEERRSGAAGRVSGPKITRGGAE